MIETENENWEKAISKEENIQQHLSIAAIQSSRAGTENISCFGRGPWFIHVAAAGFPSEINVLSHCPLCRSCQIKHRMLIWILISNCSGSSFLFDKFRPGFSFGVCNYYYFSIHYSHVGYLTTGLCWRLQNFCRWFFC